MKRFVISSLSVLLASAAVAPMAQAFDTNVDADFSVHELRLQELDARNKAVKGGESFNVHQLRTSEFDQRNKVGDKITTTSLIDQRHRVLDRYGSK